MQFNIFLFEADMVTCVYASTLSALAKYDSVHEYTYMDAKLACFCEYNILCSSGSSRVRLFFICSF